MTTVFLEKKALLFNFMQEIFVNVASYAYGSEEGDVTISVDAEPDSISIVFEDSGI